MKLLKEISEKSLGISAKEILEENFKLRKSARCILLNEKNEISLQFIGKHNFYKLPGVGVEIGETEEEALKREIIEEVGCDIVIERPLGITIEYRNTQNLLHISYGFICRVKGEIKEPKYDTREVEDEYIPMWKTLDEVLKLFEEHYPEKPYQARFIVTREKAFLDEYKKIINNG
ncbi:MAG: NUDIX domain-containing protein [Candidatus Paceibacterota bacterium]|jgi:ADP-ribose pyrophosphatase YjhB (NUDIX family)